MKVLVVIAGVLSSWTTVPEPNVEKGNKRMEAGDAAAAAERYDAALKSRGDNPEIYLNLGIAKQKLAENGDAQVSEAMASLDAATKSDDPKIRSLANYAKGNTHFQQKQWVPAIKAYKQALTDDPNNDDARHNYELALSKLPPPPPRFKQKPGQKGDPKDGKPADGQCDSQGNRPGDKDGQPKSGNGGGQPKDGKGQQGDKDKDKNGAGKDKGKDKDKTKGAGDLQRSPDDGRSKAERLSDLERGSNRARRQKMKNQAAKNSSGNNKHTRRQDW